MKKFRTGAIRWQYGRDTLSSSYKKDFIRGARTLGKGFHTLSFKHGEYYTLRSRSWKGDIEVSE